MRTLITIGELADMMQTSTSSIRYYEKEGLIKPNTVTDNGYRLYDIHEVDRLETILYLRDLDISINQLKLMLDGYQIDDYLDVLRSSLHSLDQEIKLLKIKKIYISQKIRSAKHLKKFKNTYRIVKSKERHYLEIHKGKIFDYTIKEIYEILKAKNIRWLNQTHEYQIISMDYQSFQLCSNINPHSIASQHEEVLVLEEGDYLVYGFFVDPSEPIDQAILKKIKLFKDYLFEHELKTQGSLITLENLHLSEFNLQKLYIELQQKVKI